MNRLFLYNIVGKKLEAIRRVSLWLGLSPVEVESADFGKPLGALLGDGDSGPGEEASFDDEMLVMEELSSPLLDMLRREGIAIALKAVVTEQNRTWSSAALCRELRREHEALRAASAKKHVHPHRKRK